MSPWSQTCSRAARTTRPRFLGCCVVACPAVRASSRGWQPAALVLHVSRAAMPCAVQPVASTHCSPSWRRQRRTTRVGEWKRRGRRGRGACCVCGAGVAACCWCESTVPSVSMPQRHDLPADAGRGPIHGCCRRLWPAHRNTVVLALEMRRSRGGKLQGVGPGLCLLGGPLTSPWTRPALTRRRMALALPAQAAAPTAAVVVVVVVVVPTSEVAQRRQGASPPSVRRWRRRCDGCRTTRPRTPARCSDSTSAARSQSWCYLFPWTAQTS